MARSAARDNDGLNRLMDSGGTAGLDFSELRLAPDAGNGTGDVFWA
jgi:hypothetical protein